MSDYVQVADLDKAIKKILDEYGDEVKQTLDETTKAVSTKGKNKVKDAAPVGVRNGKYKKSISLKKTKGDLNTVEYKIYAKAPEYRLTHLLEKGHAIHNGTGRTKKYPHWSKGQEYIEENFEKEFKERIENGR